jgi:SM-20-related protein
MLNLNRIRSCQRFEYPFVFGVVENPFEDIVDAQVLAREFPVHGFEYCQHGSGRFFRRPLFQRGNTAPYLPEQLGAKTLALMELLASPQYHRALAEALSVDIDGAQLEGWFWRYDAGTQFVPHRDQETKLLTQVFYLNERWPGTAGGRLRILNSEESEDIAYEITPHLRLSTIIKRSDSSWHLITPISVDAVESRNTITVHLHRL